MASIDYNKLSTEELLEYLMKYSSDLMTYGRDVRIIKQIIEDRRNAKVSIPTGLRRAKGKYSFNSELSFDSSEDACMARERDNAIGEMLQLCDYKEGAVCYAPGWSADNGAWISVYISSAINSHPYRFATNESCLYAISKLGKRKLDLIYNYPVGKRVVVASPCPCPPTPVPPCPPCPPPFPPHPVPPGEMSVKLSLDPVDGTYEMGETIPFPVTLTAKIDGVYGRTVFIQFARDDRVIYSVPYISGTEDEYVFSYSDPENPINTDTKFDVAIIAGSQTVQDTKWYKFGYACYIGYSEDGSTPDTLREMTKIGLDKQSFVYEYTCYGKYPVLAYPASWGELARIRDENGFTITQTFEKHVRTYLLQDGEEISYLVYILDHPVNIDLFQIKFLFEDV